MVVTVKSCGLLGTEGYMVDVEADVSGGLPAFDLVGLPQASVKEAKNRVRAALRNCAGEFPLCRVTVNLAPADTEKEGSAFDLPILISVAAAAGLIPAMPEGTALCGELSLSGEVKPITGAVSIAAAAAENNIKRLIVPLQNAAEAAVLESGVEICGMTHVSELFAELRGEKALPAFVKEAERDEDFYAGLPDFSEIKGQGFAKRALEVAAAGGHNILMIGPPGAGKSMLAKCMPSIMPPLSRQESAEVTKIHSAAGIGASGLIKTAPFRSPHHTISAVGLAGGGRFPRPGEISLAHRGVLFLDELPEFSRGSLEILRQPLEDRRLTVSRAAGARTFPADFLLVCAMNPCRCAGGESCKCTQKEKRIYLSHISGPLLDRIDLCAEVPALTIGEIESRGPGESSAAIRFRVEAARQLQKERLSPYGISLNGRIPRRLLDTTCRMTERASKLLHSAFESLRMSARGYDRLLKTARTIADLGKNEIIGEADIAEALSYRSAERLFFRPGLT